MSSVATLKDNFNDGVTNTSLWTAFGTTSEASQQLRVTSTIGAGSYGGYASVAKYDLTGSRIYVRLIDAGNQAIATWQALPILLALDASNTISWYVSGGMLHAQTQVAGIYTDVRGDLTYNSMLHKFFCVRESGGTIYWEYSTDNKIWYTYTSTANPFALTALEVDIIAGHYGTETVQTVAAFDSVNVDETATSAVWSRNPSRDVPTVAYSSSATYNSGVYVTPDQGQDYEAKNYTNWGSQAKNQSGWTANPAADTTLTYEPAAVTYDTIYSVYDGVSGESPLSTKGETFWSV